MAGPKQASRGMTDAQINAAMTTQLVSAGYTRQQATQLLTMANTMARGRDVGAPPSWMNGTDLDRASRAIFEARNDRAEAERILGRTRISGPNMTEAQMRDALQTQLVSRGYSEEQARNIMGYAGRMARGERLTVPASWGWLNVPDLTQATRLMNDGINHPDRARSIVAAEDPALTRRFRGPTRSMSLAMVPSPVRQYRNRFEVAVAGQTYTLDANQTMQLGGIITRADQTDAGRLMAILDNRSVPSSDLKITDEQGNVVSRAQFLAVVRPRYRAIQQEFARATTEGREPDAGIIDSVDVSRVRRPPA